MSFQLQNTGYRQPNVTTLIGYNNVADFKQIPVIPKDLSLSEAHLLIPEGFEDQVSYEIDEASQSLKLLILSDKEGQDDAEIIIPPSVFNPTRCGCTFPKFLIDVSLLAPNIDYFDLSNRLILNQNELLWLILQHRLVDFKKHRSAFAGLINSTDLKAIRNFMNHTPYTAYNAVRREENSYIILSIYDYVNKSLKVVGNNQCIGTLIKNKQYFTHPKAIKGLLQKLPLHYTPESMGAENKFILRPYDDKEEIYRSIGHKLTRQDDGTYSCISLFPVKSNLPARTKTHIGADAHRVANFVPTSPFIQDYIPNMELQQYMPKDECYVETLVAIHPIITEPSPKGPPLIDKFLYGEIDANEEFVATKVCVRQALTEPFEDLFVELGKTYQANHQNKILVGTDIEGKEVFLENCFSATLMNSIPTGGLGYQKLIFSVVRNSGNARLDSNTGLKGVTVARKNLGKIKIKQSGIDPEFLRQYSGYEEKGVTTLSPTLIFGMNSFKAKANGIALARAALAVKIGTYKPKHKTGYLNTWDAEEIQAACDSLPEYTYTDMFGNVQKVQIGLVYARFTELGSTYRSYKKQAFSFETGRWLSTMKDQTLFKGIWEKYVDQDRKRTVLEFQKILLDSKDLFDDGLPIYSLQQIKAKRCLDEKDLVMRSRLSVESMSKLFDPTWNENGFILNLTAAGAGYVRIPSAHSFNLFISKTEGGSYIYPQLVKKVSQIFQYIFTRREHLLKKTPKQRYNLIEAYKAEINGMLYSDEEASMMLVQTLSRPEVPGFAGKQMTDVLLPPRTAVLFDTHTWKQAALDALGEDYEKVELMGGFRGLHVRAPSLWRRQKCPLTIWNTTDFQIYLHHKYNIRLEDYISAHLNKDLVFLSTDILEDNQADLDGDFASVYTPEGKELQEALRDHDDDLIVQAETDWIKAYIAGERESNDDLIDPKTKELIHPTYTLYNVPLKTTRITARNIRIGFDTFLVQAMESKGNIGSSTNNSWLVSMILSCYQNKFNEDKGKFTTPKGEVKALRPLSFEEANEISSYYIIALQQFVIRGVKHNESGSAAFECLFLKNMVDPNNTENVMQLLTVDLGMSFKLASKFLFVMQWAEETGFLEATGTFLRLYNKGTIPDKNQQELLDNLGSFIQKNTYFGGLLEELYQLRQIADETRLAVREAKLEAKARFEQDFNTGEIDMKTIMNPFG